MFLREDDRVKSYFLIICWGIFPPLTLLLFFFFPIIYLAAFFFVSFAAAVMVVTGRDITGSTSARTLLSAVPTAILLLLLFLDCTAPSRFWLSGRAGRQKISRSKVRFSVPARQYFNLLYLIICRFWMLLRHYFIQD